MPVSFTFDGRIQFYMMSEAVQKTCLECGRELVGRRDKKYCDDTCRSNYNNRIVGELSPEMRRINAVLKKNRKILETLLGTEAKIKVPGKRLKESGFDFLYHTHLYSTQTGNTYHYCYEFGLLSLEADFFLIVKKDRKPEG